jgi:hypothetical protein
MMEPKITSEETTDFERILENYEGGTDSVYVKFSVCPITRHVTLHEWGILEFSTLPLQRGD